MLLSVVLPVHNTGKYLEKCVESVYQQGLDLHDFEVILVNNASTDNSLEICHLLEEKHPNILVIDTKVPGVSNARNLGMQKAQGRFVHFVDSDDCLLVGMYDVYKQSAEKDDPDLIVSGIDNYYETDGTHIVQKPSEKQLLCEKEAMCACIRIMTPEEKIWLLNVVWNKWYKLESLKKICAAFDATLKVGEDFVFNCSVYPRLQSCSILPQAFYLYYHRNNRSALNQFHSGELERRRRMEIEQKSLYHKLGICDKDREIEILNGELLFRHLYSIFRSDCRIDKKEYIKAVIQDDLFENVIAFFARNPNFYYKILQFLAKHRNYNGFYYVLKTKYVLSSQSRQQG